MDSKPMNEKRHAVARQRLGVRQPFRLRGHALGATLARLSRSSDLQNDLGNAQSGGGPPHSKALPRIKFLHHASLAFDYS